MVDFETFFSEDYHMGRDTKALTTIEYVQDERFEVLGCGFLHIQAEVNYPCVETQTQFIVGEEAVKKKLAYYQSLYGKHLENCTVIAQNAVFDLCVLNRRHGIACSRTVDILGLARHWHSRSNNNDLAALCKRHGLKDKGETENFKGLTLRTRYKKPTKKRGSKMPVQIPLATDDQLKALAEYGSNDVKREWELFEILLPKLSNPTVELQLMQHTLDLFLKPTLELDYGKADELITLMQKEIDDAVQRTGVSAEELSGDKSFSGLLDTALETAGDHPQKYYKVGKRGYLLAIAKTDPEREQLENHPVEYVRILMQGRLALESWPKHIQRIKRMVRMAKCDGGKLPIPLKYCGAHTRRWAGEDKINSQNFGSRGHKLANAVRTVIAAPAGKVLAIVDEAAVEARGLAWIAGQQDLVAKFKNNEEIYCGFATKVLGWPVRKPKKEGGIPAIESRMKWARNSIGKIGILGCGYQMGPGDKQTQTPKDMFRDAGLDWEMACKIVNTYRSEHPEIVKFWANVEKAFVYTAKYKQSCSLPRGLMFDSRDYCDVVITLPSGGEIKYHNVRLYENQWGKEACEVYNDQLHTWESTYGGSLTENIVQSLCRDTLAEAMLRLEERGYHTTFHAHDELIMLVDEDQGKAAVEAGIAELSREPVWAPGMPLSAEGGVSKCYTKL